MISIELYGVARVRAGRAICSVSASTAGEALHALETQCPSLTGQIICDDSLSAAYRLSLNGELFVQDLSTRIRPGDVLLLIAADAGG